MITGSHVGSAFPAWQGDSGESAPRQLISFYCGGAHTTAVTFAIDARVPDRWDCSTCGLPAGLDPKHPPAPPVHVPVRSHLEYVVERRHPDDVDALIDEMLARRHIKKGRRR